MRFLAVSQDKSTERPLVVVDTDPGTDDALAIYMLLAAQSRGLLDLLGIVCVAGNTSVDHAVTNTFRILHSVNRLDMPVYRGSPQAIIKDPKPKIDPYTQSDVPFHGYDGFGDATHDVEPGIAPLRKEHGVLKLLELAREHRGELNVVCLGPLTNVALAMKLDPEFASNVKHFYIMGGNFTAKGNITSTAEYNFHCDPEAAHIVLANSLCHVTIAPWETCEGVTYPYEWRSEVLGKAGTPQAEMLNKIEESVRQRVKHMFSAWYTCDAVITSVLIKPEMATKVEMCHMTVELHGAQTRGQVVVDHLKQSADNVRLIRDVDKDVFEQLMLMAVDHPDCSIAG